MKLLFLDTETTGLNSQACAIHQLSGIIVIDNKIRETFDFRIKPFDDAEIDNEALEVSHIESKSELYTSDRLSYEECYIQFTEMLNKYCNKYDRKDKFFLAGYNVHFDKDFLYEFFLRNGDNYLFSYIWGNHLDIMVLATQQLLEYRTQMVNFKQITVAKFIGLNIDESKFHDSLYDVIICMNIYKYLTKAPLELDENITQNIGIPNLESTNKS